jgi:hypothetical protein
MSNQNRGSSLPNRNVIFLRRNSEPDDIDIIDSYVGPRSSLNSDVSTFTPDAPVTELPPTPRSGVYGEPPGAPRIPHSHLMDMLNNPPTMRRSRATYNLLSNDQPEQAEERPRTLTRTFAMTDLNDTSSFLPPSAEGDLIQPRTIRYNDDDQISYMSFSTEDEDDRESVYAGQEPSYIEEEDISSVFEEDSDEYDDVSSDTDSISNAKTNILDNCLNESPITLTNYEDTDLRDLFIIHIPNKDGKFVKGSCLLRDEMKNILNSDLETYPNYVMSIYTTPSSKYKDDLLTGLSGKPTGKIVIRMPTNQIYITFGSMKRVLTNPTIKWYALPLYGGKRRRIGNIAGIYGASMNHGQVPGFQIYKLFTEAEIKSNIVVREDSSDFPHSFQYDSMKPLFDILGETPIRTFISNVINELINANIRARPIILPRSSSLQELSTERPRRERRYGNPPE